MKKKKTCQVCKKETKTLIRFEDDKIDKDLAVCLPCYSEIGQRGLPKWIDVPTRNNVYGGEHKP